MIPAPHRVPDAEASARELAHQLEHTTDPRRAKQLRHELALCALPLAEGLARRLRDRGVEVEDLEQVARTAVVAAAERYDPARGVAFLAYAAPTVSGELKRYFRDHTWAVRPPRRLQELRLASSAAEEDLRHRLRRDPTRAELADELGVTLDEVDELRLSVAAYRSASLDEPTPTGSLLGDVLVGPRATPDAVSHLALAEAVESLTDRERRILHLRFDEELTQREIGACLGVSQMQVSRLLAAILSRLRPAVLPAAS